MPETQKIEVPTLKAHVPQAASNLSMDEKLEIANSGGMFQESGDGSWVGTKIRKGTKLGTVIRDMNGAYRELVVRFSDGSEEEIQLNNMGPDPEYVHQYEFQSKRQGEDVWYKF